MAIYNSDLNHMTYQELHRVLHLNEQLFNDALKKWSGHKHNTPEHDTIRNQALATLQERNNRIEEIRSEIKKRVVATK